MLTLPFAYTPRRGVFSFLAIFSIYVAIYLKDWASQWLTLSVAAGLLALGLFIGLCGLAVQRDSYKNNSNLSRLSLGVFVFFSAAWILTFAAKGTANLSSYYIAVPFAIVIVNLNPNLFYRIIVFHFGVTLAIQVLEYFTGHYFFIYQASDGTELNELLFGGHAEVFRAKGMFQGPLSAVAFGLLVMFLTRGSTFIAAMVLFSSFLASGRLGMLTAVIMFGFRYLIMGVNSLRKSFTYAILLAAVAYFLWASMDVSRALFILNALDFGNDQNVGRFYFWLSGLSYYLSYGPIDFLFGNQGFILMREGGTENDFLRLLLDCGLVGFLLYGGAIVTLIARAVKSKDFEGVLSASLIIVLMNLFPFFQSLSSALLFWVYFFSKMEQLRGQKPSKAKLSQFTVQS
ncbi:MAG: hypothetical protein ACKO0Z_28630 [Betaproteobacteria bacterium]